MIAMAILLAILPAMADSPRDGQIVITIGDESSEFPREGIVLAAYLIAKGEYGDWTPLGEFSDITISTHDDGSTWVGKSLDEIHDKIVAANMSATQKATSDADGVVHFKHLEHGIYFIEMVSTPDSRLTMKKMLLSTPDKYNNIIATANAKTDYDKFKKQEETTEETPEEETEPEPENPKKPKSKPKAVEPIKTFPTRRGQHLESIDEYETALGLGNIQMHVGVCFE